MLYTKKGHGINLQAEKALMVSANDATTYLFEAGQVYVGTAGTVVLITSGQADQNTNTGASTFIGVPAGTVLPVLATRILSTGTTSTGFVILY
jgi:hypothetical protein